MSRYDSAREGITAAGVLLVVILVSGPFVRRLPHLWARVANEETTLDAAGRAVQRFLGSLERKTRLRLREFCRSHRNRNRAGIASQKGSGRDPG